MVAALDSGLEFYRQVLALRGYRQEILAADIANASTPGFKSVDLDFAAALKAAGAASSGPLWLVDDARHLQPGGGAAGGLPAGAAGMVKYEVGNEVTLDGNSVDLDRAKMKSAENAVDYEAAATFAAQTLKMLQIAINGSPGQQANGG